MEPWKSIPLVCGLGACVIAGCGGEPEDGAEPWRGSLRDGLERIESLADDGAFDDALAVADRMVVPDSFARSRAWLDAVSRGASESLLSPITCALDVLGVDALTAADRGEVEYARAIVLLRSAQVAPADDPATADDPAPAAEDAAGRMRRAIDAFGRARAAGGAARLDAVYDLGTLDLLQAEAIYMTIPEVSGGPPPPPASSKDDAAAKDDQDPLDVARSAYLAAREDYVERLLLAPDDDTRANVELVLRRLRELDDIEREREEQQEQNQNQGDQQDPSDQSDQEGEPSDEDQEQEPSESESEDDESQDPGDENQQDPEEGEDPAEEEPQPEEAESEEGEDEESSEPEEAEAAEEPEEKLMTDEERKRVMERNRAYQENGEKLRRILRMRRKVPSKRDW